MKNNEFKKAIAVAKTTGTSNLSINSLTVAGAVTLNSSTKITGGSEVYADTSGTNYGATFHVKNDGNSYRACVFSNDNSGYEVARFYNNNAGVGSNGIEVYTNGTDATTPTYGGYFQNLATTGKQVGVRASVSSTNGISYGIYAEQSATSCSTTSYGGYFKNASATDNSLGIYVAMTGTSGLTYGGYFDSDSNTNNAKGVYSTMQGASGNVIAIHGKVASSGATSTGVYGQASSGYGVYGYASGGYGVVGSGATYNFYAAGSGTDYGTFTGGHDGLVIKGHDIEQGDIVRDTSILYSNGFNNCLTVIEKASGINSHNVGVFASSHTFDEETLINALTDEEKLALKDTYDRSIMNSVGEGKINVCGEGGDISIGDLIVTSSTAGKGMKQADNICYNYTVAKSRENVTFTSASEVKQIACIYLGG